MGRARAGDPTGPPPRPAPPAQCWDAGSAPGVASPADVLGLGGTARRRWSRVHQSHPALLCHYRLLTLMLALKRAPHRRPPAALSACPDSKGPPETPVSPQRPGEGDRATPRRGAAVRSGSRPSLRQARSRPLPRLARADSSVDGTLGLHGEASVPPPQGQGRFLASCTLTPRGSERCWVTEPGRGGARLLGPSTWLLALEGGGLRRELWVHL